MADPSLSRSYRALVTQAARVYIGRKAFAFAALVLMMAEQNNDGQTLRVLHAYKVFPPDVVGGITEVIAYIAEGMAPRHESSVLVARSRGWGRRYTFGTIPVEALCSFGTLLSTPIAPSFPFVLAKRSRKADLVALHQPFPLNDIGVSLGLPRETALVVHWHGEIVRQRSLTGLIAPFIRHTLARAQRIIVSHPTLVSASPFLAASRRKMRDHSLWHRRALLGGTRRRAAAAGRGTALPVSAPGGVRLDVF